MECFSFADFSLFSFDLPVIWGNNTENIHDGDFHTPNRIKGPTDLSHEGPWPRVRNYCGHGYLGEDSQFHPSSLRIYQHQLEVHKLQGCDLNITHGGRKQVHHVMDIIFVSSILMDGILRFFLGSNKSWVSKWIHGSYLRKNLAGNSKIMKLQDDLYIKYGLNGV